MATISFISPGTLCACCLCAGGVVSFDKVLSPSHVRILSSPPTDKFSQKRLEVLCTNARARMYIFYTLPSGAVKLRLLGIATIPLFLAPLTLCNDFKFSRKGISALRRSTFWGRHFSAEKCLRFGPVGLQTPQNAQHRIAGDFRCILLFRIGTAVRFAVFAGATAPRPSAAVATADSDGKRCRGAEATFRSQRIHHTDKGHRREKYAEHISRRLPMREP